MMSNLVKNRAILVFAILFLAAILRAYQLGTESLWLDEGETLRFSMLSPTDIVEGSKEDNNYPTYYLILHYWVAFFGDSEVSLRFPSWLASVLAVLVMYRLGSLLFSRNVGLVASLILALSPFHIRYAQEARNYSLLALLALLSFYFVVKLLIDHKLSARVNYILCTLALMYSHVYGLFVVMSQNVYFLAIFLGRTFRSRSEARPSLRKWGALQALLFVLYLPGFILLVGWISAGSSLHPWIQPPSLYSVYKDLVQYAGSPLLLALLLAFSLLAAVALVKSGSLNKLCLLLAWLLTSIALPIAYSSFFTPMWSARYGIAGSLALYLLAAKGVEVTSDAVSRTFLRGIPKALKSRTVWVIVTAVLIMLFTRELWSYFNTVRNPQWREVAQYVDTHAQNNDLILVEGLLMQENLFNYYSQRTDIETKSSQRTELETRGDLEGLVMLDYYSERTDTGTESTQPLGAQPLDTGEAMEPSVETHDRVWSVRPSISNFNERLRLKESVYEEEHSPIDYEKYQQIDLTLYEKR